MAIFIALQEFLHDLRGQKLRAFLTVFGIMWGTVAVVVLLAFGAGFQRQTAKNMHGIGERIAIVFPGRTTKPYQGFGIGRQIRFMEDDAELMAREIPEIAVVCPEYARWNSVLRHGTKTIRPLVSGVVPEYADIRNIIPEPGGRFLNQLDLEKRRHVIFLGDSLKYFLFGDSQAIGEHVLLDGVPFVVAGVMRHKRQNSSYNRRDQDRAFIPTTTFKAFFGHRYINNLVYTPRDARLSPRVQERLYEVLGKKHKFDPKDKNALWIWDTAESDKILVYFFLGFNLFMGLIGGLTLVVGGIGVANIMYVVVQERTREIGIKRAVGAHKRDILLQFFSESFFIIGAGALLGFLVSLALLRVARLIPMGDFVGYPTLSPPVLMVTVAILGLVGLVAGFFPARRAANLNPIECLRYG